MESLTEADCPLVALADGARLIERFNRTLQLCMLIESECNQSTLGATAFLAVQKDLQAVRDALSRQRYHVGFLGSFQGGKSTTFNRLVGVDVAKSGDGGATTATITRIQPVAEGDHHLELNYLTQEQYERKAAVGREATGFEPDTTDQQVLAAIARRLREAAEVRDDELKRNLNYLESLLKSYQVHRGKLGVAGERAAFDDRDRYLNHTRAGGSASVAHIESAPLLHDVVVRVRTSEVASELEMIDLPGLGSAFNSDDSLTTDYLKRKLDGALIFCKADAVEDRFIGWLLKNLPFKDVRGRVWIVFSKADSLTTQLRGESTVFDIIRRFMGSLSVPLEQVCFLTNAREKLKDADKDVDALNKPELAALRSAWQAIFEPDGGLARLRSIVREDVPNGLRASIAADAEKTLHKVARRLWQIGESDLGDGKEELRLQRVSAAINELNRLCLEVRRGRKWLNCVDVLERLIDRLNELNFVPAVLDQRRDFKVQWRRGTSRLQALLEQLMRNELVDAAYSALLPELQRIEEEGPELLGVPATMAEGLVHAWEEYRALDRATNDWRQDDFPSFVRNNPYDNQGNELEQPFDGGEFLALLREKTRVVSHQLPHALRGRLCDRLQEIDGYLSEYVQAGIERESHQKSEKLERELKGYEDLCR